MPHSLKLTGIKIIKECCSEKGEGGMGIFISVLFLVSFAMFAGAVHNLLALNKPGMYPPKVVLRKKAGSLAGGGTIFLLIGIIFYSFH